MTAMRSYIICTSPRSGSTLLCHLLRATGCCGVPDSHFHEPSLAAWAEDHGVGLGTFASNRAALRAVLDAALARGRGMSEMFGLRLQRQSADFLLAQLATLHPGAGTDRARLEAAFGPADFVHLRRESKLDQAISYVKAQQCGLWHRAPDGTEIERLSPHRAPVYDAAALTRQIAEFEAHDREWAAWFEREGVTPLRLSYEALAADPLAGLATVLEGLGVDPDLARGIALPVARLADATNESWARRYRTVRC